MRTQRYYLSFLGYLSSKCFVVLVETTNAFGEGLFWEHHLKNLLHRRKGSADRVDFVEKYGLFAKFVFLVSR